MIGVKFENRISSITKKLAEMGVRTVLIGAIRIVHSVNKKHHSIEGILLLIFPEVFQNLLCRAIIGCTRAGPVHTCNKTSGRICQSVAHIGHHIYCFLVVSFVWRDKPAVLLVSESIFFETALHNGKICPQRVFAHQRDPIFT